MPGQPGRDVANGKGGRLSVASDLINLSLAALDPIKAMLDEAAGRGEASFAARPRS